MPTSRTESPRGFSLVELLLVISIVAMASSMVVVAISDAQRSHLDKLAVQIGAELERGRALSRSLGVPLWWRPTARGYIISPTADAPAIGIPESDEKTLPDPDLQLHGSPIRLGPEPIIPAAQLRLQLKGQTERSVTLSTQGLAPFELDHNDAH